VRLQLEELPIKPFADRSGTCFPDVAPVFHLPGTTLGMQARAIPI
jgi:hypothetical protein